MWERRAATWSVRMTSLDTGGRFGTLTDFKVIGEDPCCNVRHPLRPHVLWRDILRFAGWWHAGVPVRDIVWLSPRDRRFHNLYVSLMVHWIMLLLAWRRNDSV